MWLIYNPKTNTDMTRTITLIITSLLVNFAFAQSDFVDENHLELKWKTDNIFDTPEGIVFDPELNVLFVSNIGGDEPWTKDGVGFISKMDLDGNVIEKEWISGLDGPKGMGIYNNSLYVSNIDEVVKIDIAKGEIVKRIPIKDAANLNDIDIDDQGKVYVSDSKMQKVHILVDDSPSVYYEDDSFKNSNGVLIANKQVLLATGNDIVILPAEGKAEILLKETGGVDGIGQISENTYIYSHWPGRIFIHEVSKEKVKILEYPGKTKGTADICYLPERKILFIPTFFENRVECYQVK